MIVRFLHRHDYCIYNYRPESRGFCDDFFEEMARYQAERMTAGPWGGPTFHQCHALAKSGMVRKPTGEYVLYRSRSGAARSDRRHVARNLPLFRDLR